jgi:hypothetical protein
MGLSLHKGPVGGPGGGFVYRGLRETVEQRSVNAACLPMEALREETGGMAPLLGTLKAT